MYEYTKTGPNHTTEMPQAVQFDTTDSPELTKIKHLIQDMTSFEWFLRPSAYDVMMRIQNIALQVIEC